MTPAVSPLHSMPPETTHQPSQIPVRGLAAEVPVSIVVATLDRPRDLEACLQALVSQVTPRRVEIVVVDNNPSSGLTPPVVGKFPPVVLVNEPRRGLAYARNAGIAASRGEIIVTTDDDVIAPPEWLETLLAPFVDDRVAVVTGNVLPLELETEAQQLFETYGGLGRGTQPLLADRNWTSRFRLRAIPTWRLGATANAAFRARIFRHPRIGLLEETLGPGMPSGVGEDTYLFYKVLKAGDAIAYHPAAFVWHRHRRDLPSLRKQIFDYSKGHVAYHLTTLLRDGDLRALCHLALTLPLWRCYQIFTYLSGRSRYPLHLILLEICGNALGPWAWWQSQRRVKREGRSSLPPYRCRA
ncbi:MAG: glycosyltransferase [Candidatus Binatia bacterium]|nr:glycosyltransferase [Candidatus Binatia bacterium]